MLPNGTMAKQSDRVFADLRGSELGVPDGTEVKVLNGYRPPSNKKITQRA